MCYSFNAHGFISEAHILCFLFECLSTQRPSWIKPTQVGSVTRTIVFVQNIDSYIEGRYDSLPLSPFLSATYAILCSSSHHPRLIRQYVVFVFLYQFCYLSLSQTCTLTLIYNICTSISLTTITAQEIRCLENGFSQALLCWSVLSRKTNCPRERSELPEHSPSQSAYTPPTPIPFLHINTYLCLKLLSKRFQTQALVYRGNSYEQISVVNACEMTHFMQNKMFNWKITLLNQIKVLQRVSGLMALL